MEYCSCQVKQVGKQVALTFIQDGLGGSVLKLFGFVGVLHGSYFKKGKQGSFWNEMVLVFCFVVILILLLL
jgi:hypothetical protein